MSYKEFECEWALKIRALAQRFMQIVLLEFLIYSSNSKTRKRGAASRVYVGCPVRLLTSFIRSKSRNILVMETHSLPCSVL